MVASVNASTSSGVVVTSDLSGQLALQSNGTTVATVTSSGLNLPTNNTLNTANTFGFKNRLINGNGIIYQRASSAALSTTASYVSCDRWFAGQETAAASTFGISSTGLGVGFAQQMALNRNNGSTGTGRIYAGQIIESNNLLDLQSKTITFSFTARAGTNFSATSSSIQVQVYSGTTADQGLTSLQAGSWTGLTAPLDTTQVITTTNTTYSFSCAVPSGCKELAVFVRFTPTGTAGADDTLYFTNAQLEVGSQATSFDFRPYGTELQLCQRYLPAINSTSTNSIISGGYSYSATNAQVPVVLPVTPRVPPTGITSSAASTFQFQGNSNYNASTITFNGASNAIASFVLGGMSGLTVGGGGQCVFNATSGQLLFTGCEL